MTDAEKLAGLEALEQKIAAFITTLGRGTQAEHIEPDLLFLTRVLRDEVQLRLAAATVPVKRARGRRP